MPTKLAEATTFGTLEVLVPSWERSLRAGNKSPATIRSYGDSARFFEAFLVRQGMPTTVAMLNRDHVESYISDQLVKWRPTTGAVRYRSLQQLFKWLLEEGEIRSNPMERTKPPIVPETPVPVIGDEDLKRLLRVCEGKRFEDRRDTAILRVFIDTGARLGEVTGMKKDDVDFEAEVVIVTGKGRRTRAVPFSARTSRALDQYLRLRPRHNQASSLAMWLGPKGGMTDSGISQMIERRCAEAGIARLHPHQLRHTAAHQWLAAGGSETGAMRNFGWRSRTMLSRYGASAADERARDEAHRLALGDRL